MHMCNTKNKTKQKTLIEKWSDHLWLSALGMVGAEGVGEGELEEEGGQRYIQL